MAERVRPEDVQAWQASVGQGESRTETLSVEPLRRFAAAIGQDLDVERIQPSLGHWAYFLPLFPDNEMGADGHPRRGGFMPAITLPRRMFAGSKITFTAPLKLGKPATREAKIASVTHKAGKTGDLVFVEVDHTVTQDGAVAVTERQTIVFRDVGEPTPPVAPVPQSAGPEDEVWQPGTPHLFRFSAVTFNCHRIHYDEAYTAKEEGYPGLLVHGPFTACKLHGYARKRAGRDLKTYVFRAVAPLFVGPAIRLTPGKEPGAVEAIRCDGAVSMSATAS